MGEAYGTFAEVYDTFMDNVPYREWAGYIEKTLRQQGIEDGSGMRDREHDRGAGRCRV